MCQSRFSDSAGLQRHKRAIHYGIRFKCCECDRLFNQRNRCKKHIEKAHENMNVTIEKVALDPEIHSRIQNDIHKEYKCDICPASFTRKFALTRHSKVAHSVNRYNCMRCQKSFKVGFVIIYSQFIFTIILF
jgi:uncharacterized Zn-finger protein